jgi:hypothetical protein
MSRDFVIASRDLRQDLLTSSAGELTLSASPRTFSQSFGTLSSHPGICGKVRSPRQRTSSPCQRVRGVSRKSRDFMPESRDSAATSAHLVIGSADFLSESRDFAAAPGDSLAMSRALPRCLLTLRRSPGIYCKLSGLHYEIASSWAASGRPGHAAFSESRDGSSPAGPAARRGSRFIRCQRAAMDSMPNNTSG